MLDMYCGAGTINLFLAKAAKQVIGAEIIPEAVENARENARRNGIENADFIFSAPTHLEAAEKFLQRDGVRPEVVVVDPPRKLRPPRTVWHGWTQWLLAVSSATRRLCARYNRSIQRL